jgi:acetolactate synthase-1/2/3 large subunit
VKKTGAFLVRHALEQIGVKYTYGIPGVHITEIYDELNTSDIIKPILVTHESGAAFMADGTSRSSNSIGTCIIVPAAGLTHAMSGIGEAYLDGIPLLVISGGTRRDSGRHYQVHQIDQSRILDGIVKRYFLIEKHEDIIPTIYEAYNTAIGGLPGPVFVEIPAELQLFRGIIDELPLYKSEIIYPDTDVNKIDEAIKLLTNAKHPGIYVGWGALKASPLLEELAELLVAPVSTTMQGLSVLRSNHPLHTGVGFGPASVPASQNAFEKCDVMLAVGVRFSELATGSYGVPVPEDLIHIDIDPAVFNKNYPARISIEGDANEVLRVLVEKLKESGFSSARDATLLSKSIMDDKKGYSAEWTKKRSKELVSPGFFFQALRDKVEDETFIVVDDGKHTFLTAELFPVHQTGKFLSPTDFNCMGYCIPASIGVKLNNPNNLVVSIVGDGAIQMTGMELITATTYNLGLVVFVFHDGELGQISQFQKIPLNRKTCTKLGNLNVEGVAIATGSEYMRMDSDSDIDGVMDLALAMSRKNKPVIVDVNIDYSKRTYLTKGVVKTNLGRFPMNEKMRFVARAIKRHIVG